MMLNGKNFSRCCRQKHVLGDVPLTIESSSMAFYGFTARVRRGMICPLGMGRAVRYRAASTVGAPKASSRQYGSVSGKWRTWRCQKPYFPVDLPVLIEKRLNYIP
jgi:hypothetical protein